MKGDGHVQERNALGHREFELLDVERRQVHVVDQVIEAAQVFERGLPPSSSTTSLSAGNGYASGTSRNRSPWLKSSTRSRS
jgi:hypothetical protein